MKNGAVQQMKIELQENKQYYIESSNKFLYILNGTDTDNALTTGKDKYIAVSAIDSDGNEMNNVDSAQKITYKKITIQDLREPGLVNNIQYRFTPDRSAISISWNRPIHYVDGSSLAKTTTFNAYILKQDCNDNDLVDNTMSVWSMNYKQLSNTIDLGNFIAGDYCIEVTSLWDKKEYMFGMGKSLTIG